MEHLLECPLLRQTCSLDDPMVYNDVAKECVRTMDRIGVATRQEDQKTMLTMDDFIIRGFNCIHLTSRDIGGRAYVWVSVLSRDDIPYRECTLYKRMQPLYPRLKLLLFVRCICLPVRI